MAYGVNRPNPGGGSIAPKVQSASMAPRQAAINRALTKPKHGAYAAPVEKGPKPLPVNTQFGLNQSNPDWGKDDPYKMGKNQGKPGKNVNFGEVTNPAVPGINKNGVVAVPPVAPTGPVGPAAAVDPYTTGDPELDKYLAGDDIYQAVVNSLKKNKELNKSTYDYNVNNYNTDNDTIKRRLAAKEVEDNKLLDNDYAARGMFGSGLFAKADTDLGQSYADQYTDLATQLSRNLQQLATDQQSQDALDAETLRQAQQDAITRRAQEFGIMGGPSNLTEQPGKKGGKKGNKDKGKKGKK